jgi:hypothetical protein
VEFPSVFVRDEAELVMLQTKSKTRKLFEETTLYYGQPIGTRLNDLFDQYVQESCSIGSGKRKRVIFVVSDGMPCESACSVLMHCLAYALPADDLESALVNISKKLGELGWPKPQVCGLNSHRCSRLLG